MKTATKKALKKTAEASADASPRPKKLVAAVARPGGPADRAARGARVRGAASPRHAAFRPWPLKKRSGSGARLPCLPKLIKSGATSAPRRLFRAYLPFYPERRRWPPEVAFRRLLRGALPSLCQWAPRGRNAPQGIQAAPPETAATLATARRHRSLPTQSPSRPVFPWEELRQSLRAARGRGIKSPPATG